MLKKFRAFEAPYSYDFKDPDTGLQFNAASKEDLISQIVTYRSQNGLEKLDGLPLILANYWCSQVQNAGKCHDCEPEATRGFTEYLKGGYILLKSMLLKSFASQEVAEARAAHCVQCKYNSFPDQGPFHTWAADIAIQCVGKRKTSVDEKLGLCQVCTCPLRSKVFINEKLPAFTTKQLELMNDVGCWQPSLMEKHE